MLTQAQCTIVKEACSIQFESLEDILTLPHLGQDEDGINYEEILDHYGCSRKDFDVEWVKMMDAFKSVFEEPERVVDLQDLDMLVFRHILHSFRFKWENTYPKALENLWTKLFIHSVANELHNRN